MKKYFTVLGEADKQPAGMTHPKDWCMESNMPMAMSRAEYNSGNSKINEAETGLTHRQPL